MPLQIIEAARRLETLSSSLNSEKQKQRTLERSVSIVNSEEYKDLALKLEENAKELKSFEHWEARVKGLRESLEVILNDGKELQYESTSPNRYETAYVRALESISAIATNLRSEKFKSEEERKKKVIQVVNQLETDSETLLKKGGLSNENLQQMKTAPIVINDLKTNIDEIESDMRKESLVLDTLGDVSDQLKVVLSEYESALKSLLNPLKRDLKEEYETNSGNDIKEISLEYFFDYDRCWDSIVGEFYNGMKDDFGVGERVTEVRNFFKENKEIFNQDDFSKLENYLRRFKGESKKYLEFLTEVFENETRFQIFRAIREKHLGDLPKYKVIQVTYDGKNIERASFGQRCTTVVVILLLFGNYPLIIDEPEAHLDSALIANYLVPLLKRKKADRQIIFATHNANFVINGDAEKIFILENLTGFTKILETTIESIQHRDKLLALEGGEEAFEKRGEKLNLLS